MGREKDPFVPFVPFVSKSLGGGPKQVAHGKAVVEIQFLRSDFMMLRRTPNLRSDVVAFVLKSSF